jgi:hypothetical protein
MEVGSIFQLPQFIVEKNNFRKFLGKRPMIFRCRSSQFAYGEGMEKNKSDPLKLLRGPLEAELRGNHESGLRIDRELRYRSEY